MKPVLVLQHLSADGPAYLGTWLRERGLPFELRNSEAGDTFPADLAAFGALAILGGEMSANDDLPSLRQAQRLILDGFARGVPVIGHCLGGQLMARALGARIVDSPAPEIGWQPMQVAASSQAQAWLGEPGPRTVFHWHFEAFELPPGTERLAASAACPNQAFGFGPHLGMQFHIEVDAEKIGRWSTDDGERYRAARAGFDSVQTGAEMRDGIATWLRAHHALADRVYGRWINAAS